MEASASSPRKVAGASFWLVCSSRPGCVGLGLVCSGGCPLSMAPVVVLGSTVLYILVLSTERCNSTSHALSLAPVMSSVYVRKVRVCHSGEVSLSCWEILGCAT